MLKLLKYTSINNHFINQIDNKQLFYNLIYNLSFIKLETLKTYIKIKLTYKFIKPFNLPVNTLFFLVIRKLEIFAFYINY